MYDHWSELEAETGLQLVLRTGGLDLAVRGGSGETETAFPIEAFRADRPALTDPTFVPQFRMAS